MEKIKNGIIEFLKDLVFSVIALGVFTLAASGAILIFGATIGVAILMFLIIIFVVVIDNLTDIRAE